MCHCTFFRGGAGAGGRLAKKKIPRRDKVRNLIMIGNLGQRRHTEWARKGGRFRSGWAIARETVAASLENHFFFFFTFCFSTKHCCVFLTRLPTQKVSGACSACYKKRRCYFKIIEAQASNYHAKRLQSPTIFCCLATLKISVLRNFSFYYSASCYYPFSRFYFPYESPSEQPPTIIGTNEAWRPQFAYSS